MPITPVTGIADDIEAFMREGLPRVDPKTGKLYLSNGKVLQTQKISSLRLMRLYNSTDGQPEEPQAPLEPMTYAGGLVREEPNPDNPDFQAAHALWEVEYEEWNLKKQERIMVYVFTAGIDITVPQAFIEDNEILNPGSPALLNRYDYICSQIPDEDLEFVLEALTGRSVATDKGVQEANRFLPSNGKRAGHTGLQDTERVGQDHSLNPIRASTGADSIRSHT